MDPLLLFSYSVMSDSATPRTEACQASLSFTISQSLLKLMSTESVMPSSHLNLCLPLFLLPSIFASIRVFSKWVGSSYQVAKVLELQLQHRSFPWIFRVDLLQDWPVWSSWCPRNSKESSPAPQLESISFSALSLLYGPTVTTTCDYWKSYSFAIWTFVSKVMSFFLICCLGFSQLFF